MTGALRACHNPGGILAGQAEWGKRESETF